MIDGLDSLLHDSVIGCDNEDDNVRDLGTASAHGSERFMAGRIQEDYFPGFQLDEVGTDMLGDAAGFPGRHVRVPNGVQERGLAVVDVAHDRDDRRPEDHVLHLVFLALQEIVFFETDLLGLEVEIGSR